MTHNKLPFNLPIAQPRLGEEISLHKYARTFSDNFLDYDIKNLETHLKTFSEEELENVAANRALSTFQKAADRVPAYKDFLKKNKVNTVAVQSIEDFRRVPVTNKENYVLHYPLDMRLWDGSTNAYSVVAVSSGTTGNALLWPRDLITEYESGYLHEYLIQNLFKGKSKTTLGVVGFYMGMYTAGVLTVRSLQLVSEKGYPLLIISPGMNIEDITTSITKLYSLVDQIVLFSYPSLVKSILDALERKGLSLPDVHLHLVPAGEPFSDLWKRNMLSQLSDENHSAQLFSIYGCSEKTILGHETPLSVRMHNHMAKHTTILNELNCDNIPNLYQFYPFLRYFELISGKFVFTATGGAPLIRYEIDDAGGLISFSEGKALWKKRGFDMKYFKKAPNLPFIFVKGRTGALTFYGANIYQSNIARSVEDKTISTLITGRFTMEKKYTEQDKEMLYIHIELSSGKDSTDNIKKKISSVIRKTLQNLNAEHKVVVETLGNKAVPTIILHKYGQEPYFTFEGKHKWIIY